MGRAREPVVVSLCARPAHATATQACRQGHHLHAAAQQRSCARGGTGPHGQAARGGRHHRAVPAARYQRSRFPALSRGAGEAPGQHVRSAALGRRGRGGVQSSRHAPDPCARRHACGQHRAGTRTLSPHPAHVAGQRAGAPAAGRNIRVGRARGRGRRRAGRPAHQSAGRGRRHRRARRASARQRAGASRSACAGDRTARSNRARFKHQRAAASSRVVPACQGLRPHAALRRSLRIRHARQCHSPAGVRPGAVRTGRDRSHARVDPRRHARVPDQRLHQRGAGVHRRHAPQRHQPDRPDRGRARASWGCG